MIPIFARVKLKGKGLKSYQSLEVHDLKRASDFYLEGSDTCSLYGSSRTIRTLAKNILLAFVIRLAPLTETPFYNKYPLQPYMPTV